MFKAIWFSLFNVSDPLTPVDSEPRDAGLFKVLDGLVESSFRGKSIGTGRQMALLLEAEDAFGEDASDFEQSLFGR
jgi:hypothetical protein